ncbi:transcription regulator HTH, apses-type DNA-binding domain-containing protein [Radiomyces spectabilis]|uniref:transcription regulator HTH, apses-type DNA-binding domain-containing protein n=1 Tax=Radiomyces spectabilis TaxID=64574 RepID=UPI002220CC8A|nr:transcription regulator HTH, apses-type DNA-binding domain-containing protein [Radiomyces spectabilis]KAI8374579.1 transcription regulator HTH, apses-type DNA-binding domain-containing protein [Radiomyces spectabilis]
MSHPACGVSAHEFSGYNQFCNHPSSLIPRPKLTTTLWEDEGTVCYQVDANGICVARRQDNDMINGTKLLNVTGMSRGKRDGILKNERGRVVVKVGAMHLKGVWITFSRAKALATQFKIHDILYPLFVDDLTMFVYSSSLQQGPLPPRSAPLLASHGEETYNHSTGMGGAPPADHSPMMASDFSGHYAKQTSECLYPRQLPARLHPVPADIHDGPLSPTSPTSPNGCQQPWNQRRNSLVMRASAPNGFHDPSSRHHPYSQSVYAPPTKEGVRPNFPRVSSTGYCHNGQPASFSS